MMSPLVHAGFISISFPAIETDRLKLRGLLPEAFGPYSEFMTSLRSAYLNSPYNLSEAWHASAAAASQWQLTEQAKGNGFTREAATVSLAWIWENRLCQALVSYIHPQRTSTIRLAENLGAIRDPGAAMPKGGACLVHPHFAPGVRL